MSRVDDLVGLGDRLIDQGVYIGAPGGGKITKMGPETVYFYPSPHDMQGLMAELCRIDMRNDPRLLNTWSRFHYAIVQLGDCLLQIAQPLDDASALGAHVAKWGNMIYGITFKVNDLDAAESWLRGKSIRTSRPRDGMLAADPADCFGVPYFFSTDSIPNDPFGG
jgi:hypothetical protein